MDWTLALAVLFVAAIVGTLLALVSAWSPPAGAAAIALTVTAAVFIRPDAP